MTSSPDAAMPSPVQQSNGQLHVPGTADQPVPDTKISSYPIEFSASGSEYFRIWIVNLLLIVVTCGLYLPWARVRKLKYFYGNTRVDGDALDFHGDPKKMLRGMILVGIFFALYSQSWSIAPMAGVLGVVALLFLAPILFRAAMKFRLANTSWRGMRFRFVDPGKKVMYLKILPPLLMFTLPGAFIQLTTSIQQEQAAAKAGSAGVIVGVFYLVLLFVGPYFFWSLKRLQHQHYAWGPLQTQYRSPVKDTYKIFGKTFLMFLGAIVGVVLMVFICMGLLSIVKPEGPASGPMGTIATIASFIAMYLLIIGAYVAPWAYFTARMQNLLWSRTGNDYFRFKSELMASPYVWLQIKNYLCIVFTLGLYWPFAVVASKRMRLEAVGLRTRIGLDNIANTAQQQHSDASGDVAADFFGLDIGL
jgi:uncharacterized membrane protein YjgN (DUF898 family)